MKKITISICCLSVLLFILSCSDIMMSGAQAVYNRHTLKKNISDQVIVMKAFQKIEVDDERFKNSHIVIVAFNNEVLLVGQVEALWQKKLAQTIVEKIPNVNQIYNLLEIGPPTNTLTRMNDAWITSKIKTKFIASSNIEANQIKIVTENSTVYLMGTLTPQSANAALEVARNTDGVKKVIKIFSYINISKDASVH